MAQDDQESINAGRIRAAPAAGSGGSATVQVDPRIRVTTSPPLQRIMLHELNKPGKMPRSERQIFGPPWWTLAEDPFLAGRVADLDGKDDAYFFDDAPLREYVDSLTREQRDFLLGYDLRKAGGAPRTDRLVVFVTQDSDLATLRMGTDNIDLKQRLKPQATFSVFWCRGPGRDVTLVMHTRMFCAVASPPIYHPRTTRSPPRFLVGLVNPTVQTEDALGGRLFNRVLNAGGGDWMPGNFFHGLVNSVGCWSLFRNYNWPEKHYADFEDKAYIGVYHPARGVLDTEGRQTKPVLESIAPGYDFGKFANYDRNPAYLHFFQHLVGLRPWSSNIWVNDFHPTGREVHHTIPSERVQAGVPARKDPATWPMNDFNTRLRNEHLAYSRLLRIERVMAELEGLRGRTPRDEAAIARAEAALAKDEADAKRFSTPGVWEWTPDASVIGENCLGFRTFKNFLGTGVSVEEATWADMYFYKK